MPLSPIERRSVPDAVFDQLVAGIVAGELPPGDALPSERALAEALGVSRPAVREALGRLAHAGLVEIRQGESTTVSDYRRSGSLDLLPRLLLDPDGNVDLATARSVIEVRADVGPQVAARAAARGDAALADELEAICDQMEADDRDAVALQRAAHRFWDRIVDGADNLVYRLLFNALARAYEPVMDALAVVMQAEVSRVDAFRRVAAAVRRGDADDAAAATRTILAHGTAAALEVIDRLLETDDPEGNP